jgi:hypothetical protein
MKLPGVFLCPDGKASPHAYLTQFHGITFPGWDARSLNKPEMAVLAVQVPTGAFRRQIRRKA